MSARQTRFWPLSVAVLIVLLTLSLLVPAAFAEESSVPATGLRIETSGSVPWGAESTLIARVDAGTDLVYRWDLGDGTAATGEVVTHVYALPGEYVVTLLATNSLGTSIAEAIIIIEAPTSVDLAQFGDAPESQFWRLWTGSMLVISALCVGGLVVMWRRGWLFPGRNR